MQNLTTYHTAPQFGSIFLLCVDIYRIYQQLKRQSQFFRLEALSTAQSEVCIFYSCLQ